jgi:hypothetical protein
MKKLLPVLKRNAVRIISLAALALVVRYALFKANDPQQSNETSTLRGAR